MKRCIKKILVSSVLSVLLGQLTYGMENVESTKFAITSQNLTETIFASDGARLFKLIENLRPIDMFLQSFPGISSTEKKTKTSSWRAFEKKFNDVNTKLSFFKKQINVNNFKEAECLKKYNGVVKALLSSSYGEEYSYLLAAAFAISGRLLNNEKNFLEKIDAIESQYHALTRSLLSFVQDSNVFDFLFPKINTGYSSELLSLLQSRGCNLKYVRGINLDQIEYKGQNSNVPESMIAFYSKLGFPDFSRYLHPDIKFRNFSLDMYATVDKTVYVNENADEFRYFSSEYPTCTKNVFTKLPWHSVTGDNVNIMRNHELSHAVDSIFVALFVIANNASNKEAILNTSFDVYSKFLNLSGEKVSPTLTSEWEQLIGRIKQQKFNVGTKTCDKKNIKSYIEQTCSFTSSDIVNYLYKDDARCPLSEFFQISGFVIWNDSLIYNPSNDNLLLFQMNAPLRLGHCSMHVSSILPWVHASYPVLSDEQKYGFYFFLALNDLIKKEERLNEAQRKLKNGEPLSEEEQKHKKEISEAGEDIFSVAKKNPDDLFLMLKRLPSFFVQYPEWSICLDQDFMRLLNGISEENWAKYMASINNELCPIQTSNIASSDNE